MIDDFKISGDETATPTGRGVRRIEWGNVAIATSIAALVFWAGFFSGRKTR